MIELDVKIDAKDLYDYLLRHSYNSASGIIGSCFGALMVVLAVLTGQWLYLIFGVIMLLYLPWTLFIRSKQQILSNPGFQQPLHYLLICHFADFVGLFMNRLFIRRFLPVFLFQSRSSLQYSM